MSEIVIKKIKFKKNINSYHIVFFDADNNEFICERFIRKKEDENLSDNFIMLRAVNIAIGLKDDIKKIYINNTVVVSWVKGNISEKVAKKYLYRDNRFFEYIRDIQKSGIKVEYWK